MVFYGIQKISVLKTKLLFSDQRPHLCMHIRHKIQTQFADRISVLIRNCKHFLRIHLLGYIMKHGHSPHSLLVNAVQVGKYDRVFRHHDRMIKSFLRQRNLHRCEDFLSALHSLSPSLWLIKPAFLLHHKPSHNDRIPPDTSHGTAVWAHRSASSTSAYCPIYSSRSFSSCPKNSLS